MSPNVVRIAHAYGNNRPSLQRALAAEIDMIEVDMWYRGRNVYIHHERHLSPLPILYDHVMGGHQPGPFALRLGRVFIRPDIHTIRLDELLETVGGRKRLLLDLKGRYNPRGTAAFIKTLVGKIREHRAERWIAVCGQNFAVLDPLREAAPDLEVRYSIARNWQWKAFTEKMRANPPARAVCIAYGFIDDEKAEIMEEAGVDVYCWTVDNWDDARHLVSEGVDGITSNDLELLAALPQMAAELAG